MIKVTNKQRITRLNKIPLSPLIVRGVVFGLGWFIYFIFFLVLRFLICMLLCFNFSVINLRQQQSGARTKPKAFDHWALRGYPRGVIGNT